MIKSIYFLSCYQLRKKFYNLAPSQPWSSCNLVTSKYTCYLFGRCMIWHLLVDFPLRFVSNGFCDLVMGIFSQ